jgi:iron complex outermembrane receptor protein
MHINRYAREHTGSERSIGRLYQNTGYKDDASVFIKANYAINDFSLFLDMQSRHTAFDYKGSVDFKEQKWNFFNPKAGVSVQLSRQLLGYYSIGRSGREPTRTDLFGGNDNLEVDLNGRPQIFITSEETVINHELGVRYRREKTLIDMNIYYMDFDNEIVLNGQFGPNGLALNQDVNKSIRSGIELIAEYQLPNNWRLSNIISWSKNEIEENGESFDPVLTPRLIINQELAYELDNFRASFFLSFQDKSYLDFANSEKLDSFFLFNTSITYTWEKLQAQLFINNLSDKTYYNNGLVDTDNIAKYFIGPPRNATLTLRYNL